MVRTTVMADEALLEAARAVARREGISLAEVIRQGLELRVAQRRRQPTFLGAGASGRKGHRTAERIGELRFEPRSWR